MLQDFLRKQFLLNVENFMKDLFIVLAVTISTSTFAFADSGFGISKKNNEISNEIKSRITDGLHFGVNKLGEECNVAIDGTFIKIKTPNFIRDNDRLYDCLQDDDIACFEFSNGIYPARKTWLNNGNIFKAKIIKKTDSFFHLKAKRIN